MWGTARSYFASLTLGTLTKEVTRRVKSDALFLGQEFPPEKEESSVEAPVVQETPEAPEAGRMLLEYHRI